MYASPFDYVRCASWEEAVAQLAAAGGDARVIAGGQSLVPMMLLRLATPAVLVDVDRVEPATIQRRGDRVVLSALARQVDIASSAIVRNDCACLADAASLTGNIRVRNRGTIGGSLAHAQASAELPCAAVALDATIHVLGPSGERELRAADLILTHWTTTLAADEVITRIELPVHAEREGSAFAELAPRSADIAIAEVAAVVTLDAAGSFSGGRVVVGATSGRPTDVSPALDAAIGRPLTERTAADAAQAVAAAAVIEPHPRVGADYRRAMVAVLAQRALLTAAARARGLAS